MGFCICGVYNESYSTSASWNNRRVDGESAELGQLQMTDEVIIVSLTGPNGHKLGYELSRFPPFAERD